MATIIDLELDIPLNNPYYDYLLKSAPVPTEAPNHIESGEEEIRDFYEIKKGVSKWKKVDDLENLNEDEKKASGIYMLYNSANNTIYVGKALKLYKRIKQHKSDPSDCMCDFTHFRFSIVSQDYHQLLYLIENAAIHDVACLIKMPKAKKYKHSIIKEIAGISLEDCILVNTHEHQTKLQK